MNRQQISNAIFTGIYDEQYAQFIMEHSKGERVICSGDTLLEAMEAGYMIDEFIDFMCATNGLE